MQDIGKVIRRPIADYMPDTIELDEETIRNIRARKKGKPGKSNAYTKFADVPGVKLDYFENGTMEVKYISMDDEVTEHWGEYFYIIQPHLGHCDIDVTTRMKNIARVLAIIQAGVKVSRQYGSVLMYEPIPSQGHVIHKYLLDNDVVLECFEGYEPHQLHYFYDSALCLYKKKKPEHSSHSRIFHYEFDTTMRDSGCCKKDEEEKGCDAMIDWIKGTIKSEMERLEPLVGGLISPHHGWGGRKSNRLDEINRVLDEEYGPEYRGC